MFDFPLLRGNSTLSPEIYLYYQSLHQHPIPYSIQESWLNKDPFWRQMILLQQKPSNIPIWDQFQQCQGTDCIALHHIKSDLLNKGFYYFILHLDLLDTSQQEQHLVFWRKLFGEPIEKEENTELYFLEPSLK